MYLGYYVYILIYCTENLKNNCIFNPYSSTHFIMQIGNVLDNEEANNNVWSEISEFLVRCKYKQLKHRANCSMNESSIYSHCL